jgi:hypothetical protein
VQGNLDRPWVYGFESSSFLPPLWVLKIIPNTTPTPRKTGKRAKLSVSLPGQRLVGTVGDLVSGATENREGGCRGIRTLASCRDRWAGCLIDVGDVCLLRFVCREEGVMRRAMVMFTVLGLLVAACGSDPSGSQEYQVIEEELSAVKEDLAEMEDELAQAVAQLEETSAPSKGWIGDHEVTVTLEDLGAEMGVFEVAGVLYAEPTGVPIGGFLTSGSSVLAEKLMSVDDAILQEGVAGPFFYSDWLPIGNVPLRVAPGEYVLMLWGDTGLGGFAPWVPVNTDGRGLVGCVQWVTVGDAPVTDVVFEVNPFRQGSFGVCETDVFGAEEALPVPIMERKQILYGDGDIHCPNHWADEEAIPVGSVEFRPSEGAIAVAVELTDAATDMEYSVEVFTPEMMCEPGRVTWTWPSWSMPTEPVFMTDESGSGELEFVVENVDPGTYRLNVNVVQNGWEDNWPTTQNIQLREIGGAGFSDVIVP